MPGHRAPLVRWLLTREQICDQGCQFTVTDEVPEHGTVNEWFDPPSQVVAPVLVILTNLYCTVVHAGTLATPNQFG